MRRITFCNNCGKNGHLYYQCKKPIISSGIILFKKKPTIRFLLICRKDSLGYVDFMRGKYSIHNPSYIQNLIDEMTETEKENIVNEPFEKLWANLWGSMDINLYSTEEMNSKTKFENLKTGIQTKMGNFNLKDLVDDSSTNWETPEWGFPKGRRNYQEDDKKCALREFEEETGLSRMNIDLVTNIIPFDEIFTGSNFKSYRHKYFIAMLKNGNYNMNNFQRSEVSNMRWCALQECLKLIRPYNLEKKKIIRNIHHIINSCLLVR
ncbi:hypothetical protein [uncultured Mediterranean phage]|nr:hypothetical protein [uncultured Mediterranean phage]